MIKTKFLKNLKILILDVDGVLTDGKLYYNENGEVFKIFNVKDGLGLKLILNYLNVAIISGNSSNIIRKRAHDLGIINCFLGVKNKLETLNNLINKYNLMKYEICYIGDDLNDLEVKDSVGLFLCPSDANEIILNQASYILSSKGGEGVVREFIDLYFNAIKLKNYKITYLSNI